MAEIRSTLDIIMEKAQSLTVTDEDKKDFLEKEVQGRVKGLFQKYLDGFLSIDRFKTEMASFDREQRSVAEKELLAACLRAMTVEGDNRPSFELLDRILGYRTKPILNLVDEFREMQDKERNQKTIARIRVLKKWGVSGSAVIPNLMADRAWRDYLSHMAEKFQERLKSLNIGASKKNI